MTLLKNITSYSKSVIAFLKCFKLHSNCVKYHVNDWGNFIPTLHQRLRGQNRSVGMGFIELSQTSDTVIHKPFFKHYILQTVLHVFLLFIFL